MPILKNQQKGTRNVTLIEFGTGDIEMYDANEPVNLLIMEQSEPKPLSEWSDGLEDQQQRTTDDMHPTQVWLTFSRIESIDAIISTLNRVRAKMTKSGFNNPDIEDR